MRNYSTDRAHDVNAVLYLGYSHNWTTTSKLRDRILIREPGYAGAVDPNSPTEGKYRNHSDFVDSLITGAITYLVGDGGKGAYLENSDSGFLGELRQQIAEAGYDPDEYVTKTLGCKHSLSYLSSNLPDNPTLLSEAIETALCVEVSLNPEFLQSLGVPNYLAANPVLGNASPLLRTRAMLTAPLMQRFIVPATSQVGFEMHYLDDHTPQESERLRLRYNQDNSCDKKTEELEAGFFANLVNDFPNLRIKAETKDGDDGHMCVDIMPKYGTKLELCEICALTDQLEHFCIEESKKHFKDHPPPDSPPKDGGCWRYN